MRRQISLLLVICLLLGVLPTACGINEQKAAIPEATAFSAPTSPPVEPVQHSVEVTLAPTPTPSPTPSPTPTPTPTPTPVPTPFTIGLMGDTQSLSYSDPDSLEEAGLWLKERGEEENLIALLHSGDMVDNGFKQWQWENFFRMLDQIPELPFYPVAGNHDLGVHAGSYEGFLKQPIFNAIPEEQRFRGGEIYYAFIEAGGKTLMLLGVGNEALHSHEARSWVEEVMERFSHIPCIVLIHAYVSKEGTVVQSKFERMNLVAKYENIKLVLCGHARACLLAQDSYDTDGDGETDREVPCIMLDYQETQGACPMLLFTVDPSDNTLHIRFVSLTEKELVIPELDGTVLTNIF